VTSELSEVDSGEFWFDISDGETRLRWENRLKIMHVRDRTPDLRAEVDLMSK
jgi:hypothetical protein